MSDNVVSEIQPFELAEKLQVGMTMQLKPESGSAQDKVYEVQVRGWDELKYILTSVPERIRGTTSLRPGLTVTARLLAEGVAFGFRTLIMDIQSRPASLVIMRYPGTIAMKDVRAHKRIAVFLVVTLTAGTDGQVESGECVMRDLAVGGCCIETDMELIVDTNVDLAFTLPNGKSLQKMASTVRNCREVGGRYAYGLQFLADESPKEAELIKKFFESVDDIIQDG
jgi:hypothetical protein